MTHRLIRRVTLSGVAAALVAVSLTGVVATMTSAAPATPPANDDFSARVTLNPASPSLNSQTNENATLQTNEYVASNGYTKSVWYSWTPSSTDAAATISLCPANFKARITVYSNIASLPTTSTDVVAPVSTVSCGSGASSGQTITLGVTALTPYAIQVLGDSGTSSGTFTLAVTGGGGATPSPAPTLYTEADKVTICHRTHATTNPYRLITVSTASVINESGAKATNGHAWHDPDKRRVEQGNAAGIFDTTKTYAPNEKFWGDIIPPFKDRTSGRTYDGLNWYWGSPSATLKPGSLGYWITDADFAAATSSGATADQQAAVEMCTGAAAAAIADVTKYYDKEVKDGGQKPKDVETDINEQEALDPEGRSLDPNPETAWPTVKTDPTTEFDWTSCTFKGTLPTSTTWTSWKFEYGTSDTLATFDSTAETKDATGGAKSTKVTGLTSGTQYFYRIVGRTEVAGSGGTTSETTLYGEIESCTTRKGTLGALEGNIWVDLRLDNTKSANEPYIPGITVTLTFPDGTTKSTTTDANGYYKFEDLPAGSYTVTASLPKSTGLQKSWNTGGGSTWSVMKSVAAGAVTVVDFAAVGGVTLTGPIVIDGSNRLSTDCMVEVTWAGIDGVLDTADDVSYETECKADGTYEAKGVGFGPTRVVARTPSGQYGTTRVKTITAYGVYTQPLNVPVATSTAKAQDILSKSVEIAGVISPKGVTRIVSSKPKLASGRTASVSLACGQKITGFLPRGDVGPVDRISCKYASVKNRTVVLAANAPTNLKYVLKVNAPKTKKFAAYSFTKEYRKPSA